MEFNNIFVVYDPTREEQPALTRAAMLGRDLGSNVHVFSCMHTDTAKPEDRQEDVKNILTAQQKQLNLIIAPLVDSGIAVTTEVVWDKDWYQAVVRASNRKGADLVLKSSYKHSTRQRILNKTSDWTLIRECSCPVLLVKQGELRDLRKVLAAVDVRTQLDSYTKLNQQIINLSTRINEKEGAEVHFINAHKDLSSVPDRNALIRATGANSDRVHIRLGSPEDVIVENAKALDVSLVVIGNSARSGLSATFNGNTAEKVLDRLECDLLSMP